MVLELILNDRVAVMKIRVNTTLSTGETTQYQTDVFVKESSKLVRKSFVGADFSATNQFSCSLKVLRMALRFSTGKSTSQKKRLGPFFWLLTVPIFGPIGNVSEKLDTFIFIFPRCYILTTSQNITKYYKKSLNPS